MKELWTVIVEKVKEADKDFVLLWVGIMGTITLALSAIVIVKFFKMIVDLVQLITANPGIGH